MPNLDFDKLNGLIPAVVQHAETGVVLMVGFMNAEAYQKTVETGLVAFFSRSRNTLWIKGQTSNNFLRVQEILVDCDEDTLLIKALPDGPVCHTGADTCFNEPKDKPLDFLLYLESLILDRKNNPQPDSHTSQMFEKGLKRIAQKFGEEAVEVVIESFDQNYEAFKNESADLLYRFLTLLVAKEIPLTEIVRVLKERRGK